MLSLDDLNARQGNFEIDFDGNSGISLTDLPFNRKIETKRYLDSSRWFPIDQAYVLDIESYRLNAKVRSIQLYDIEKKTVHFFAHAEIDEAVKARIYEEIKGYGIELNFYLFNSEKELIESFFEFLRKNPKHLIGHNIAHFDLGLLNQKRQKYKIEGFRFFAHNVGAGEKEVRLYFSYSVDNDSKRVPYDERFLIVDTLYISFTLNLPSRLADLALDSPFPKKEIDYSEFEKSLLGYEAVIYSIFDVLSIPYVYSELKNRIYDLTLQYLKVEEKSSQLCFEHVWEKGTGALAEAYLRKLIGRVKPFVSDHQTKYFGGITRDWVNEKVFPSDGRVIRNLDFTSAYPFAVAYQGVLDILNGDFEEYVDVKFDEEIYNELLYSAVLRFKAKKTMYVIIEVDREKDKIKTVNGKKQWDISNAFGIGYIRSFDGMEKVQDMQHEFAFLKVQRGEHFILTKAEYEMNRAFNSDFDKFVLPLKIEYGLTATRKDKSLEYLSLYGLRKELKKKGDPSQVAYKVLLNSCYGKLAESEGEWYNKACASAITSFVRAMLFKCLMKAKELGVQVLYSDTDSMYVKATEKQIRLLQDYSNKLNPLPKELYGEDNLKDEGENIICFFATKRKRYTKVIENEDGSITVVIKGGSHRDITWRHILLNLCLLTGEFDEERIKEVLANKEFPDYFHFNRTDFESLCRTIYEKYKGKDLSEVFPELKTKRAIITLSRMINLRRKSSYKEGLYHYYAVQAWQNEVWRRDLLEHGYDEYDRFLELKTYLSDLKAEKKKYDRLKTSKWQQFYELLKNELYDESYGEWFADSGIAEEYAYYFRQLAKRLNFTVIDLKNNRFYLSLFEKLKEYSDLRELINSISSVVVEDYQDPGEYLAYLDDEIYNAETKLKELEAKLKRLEKEVKKEKPYIGLFFEVWKGYRFEENYDDILEDSVFSLNYELYAVQPKIVPVIFNRDYMDALFKPLEIDTIAFILREGINLQRLDNISKKKFTKACYGLPHNGKVRHDALADYALHIRLRLNGYKELDDIEVLNKDKKAYANTELFLTPQRIFYGAFRINKWRMLEEQTDIFKVYYVAIKLQNLMRQFIEDQFRKNGVEVEIPRFSICYQIDVSQKSDENFAFEVYKAKWGKPFYTWSINKTQGLQLTKYLEWTIYPKAESVKQKLEHEELTEKEKEYFLKEAEEGWRSEIKFKLKRNIDIVLSYAYVFNALDHKSLLEFVKQSDSYYNGVMNAFRKVKTVEVKLSTRYNGIFIFGRDKVKVMWLSCVLIEGHILKSSIGKQPFDLDPLEGHGFGVEQRPPQNATGQDFDGFINVKLKGKERLGCIWQIRQDDKEFVNFEVKEMNRIEKLERTGYVNCIRD
ncbi:hypothetical protein Asulf_00969 [Archaeoglobus sulfaticallidus PM70-1]|uniref:DNA polymerase n=1 Tax=Archaeoglobus sulfaticallidus PM70-1 TaxID=387631 RepID=N0BD94_9EURY|nr:DNA polymerase domain-containing protein [Archaeoglobus sulfaticallidus]AGK60973.1 hypothetical protein Asulf_00969 [Archaeoglobus sulfaticallidus PM70-1]